MNYTPVDDISMAHYTLSQGARAALEMRSHDGPFTLEDGQMIGRLVYEPLMNAAERVYRQGIGSDDQHRGMKQSQHFKPFDLNQCY
jgi:dCTP deaminase